MSYFYIQEKRKNYRTSSRLLKNVFSKRVSGAVLELVPITYSVIKAIKYCVFSDLFGFFYEVFVLFHIYKAARHDLRSGQKFKPQPVYCSLYDKDA